MMAVAGLHEGWRRMTTLSNSAFERPAGSHALAAAAHRER